MSTYRASPFRTASEGLNASVVSFPEDAFVRPDGSYDLYSYFIGPATFDVEILVSRSALENTIAIQESSDDVLEVVVVLRSNSSRRRDIVGILPASGGLTSIEVDAERELGKVTISAAVRRKRALPSKEMGLAHRRGAVVAEQEIAVLWFDEPPTSSGSRIEIEWVDFSTDPRFLAEHLYALRLEDSAPKIFLNSGIPHAYTVLTSKGTHGAKARIRDSVFMQTVPQVWSSILTHCFLEMATSESRDESEALEALNGWERFVMLDWAPLFYPHEASPEAAATRLASDVLGGRGLLAMERLPEVLQSRFDPLKGFNGLLKDARLFDTGVTP